MSNIVEAPSMRRLAFLAFIATLPSGAASGADAVDYSRVIASVTLSLENGETDRAVLVENDDAGADLYIYRALEPARTAPPKPALVKKNAAWSGGMWGTRASLEVSDKGSLLIKSGNEGIGRDRWSQTLTVVYRDKDFIVAGLTRATHDTLDPKAGHSCDLNFLSGKGDRDGKPTTVASTPRKLADWNDEKLPQPCSF